MNLFFVQSDAIYDDRVYIRGSDVRHIVNTLRMKVGEELSICNQDDNSEYVCNISNIDDDCVTCDIRYKMERGRELSSRVHLYQGLPKGDKMELIIQKCIELGVYDITPVICSRSVVRLDEKKSKAKTARWQKIAEAAAKQCMRNIIPIIHSPIKYKDAISEVSGMQVKLIPYELCDRIDDTNNAIREIGAGMDVAVFIGPEGGYDTFEIDMAIEAGIKPISLGRRILRTETAGLCIMSRIMYRLEMEL